MHYSDQESQKQSKLVAVIYKHGTNKKDVFDYELCSIQECRYIPPHLLTKFLSEYTKILGGWLPLVHPETWNMYTLGYKVNADGEPVLCILENVDVSEWSSCYRLH